MDKLEQLKDKIEYIKDQTNYEIDLLLAKKDTIETLVDYDGGFEIKFYLNDDVYESTVSFLSSIYGGVNIEFSQCEEDEWGLVGRIGTEYEELIITRHKSFYEMLKQLNEVIDDKLDRKIKKFLRDWVYDDRKTVGYAK